MKQDKNTLCNIVGRKHTPVYFSKVNEIHARNDNTPKSVPSFTSGWAQIILRRVIILKSI